MLHVNTYLKLLGVYIGVHGTNCSDWEIKKEQLNLDYPDFFCSPNFVMNIY